MFREICNALMNKYLAQVSNSRIGAKCRLVQPVKLEGRNLISKGSTIINCSFGFASYVGDNVSLTNAKIGRYTSIGPCVSNIIGRHPTRTFASLHPAFFSLAQQVGFTYATSQLFEEYKYADEKQNSIIIGNDVWIGAHSLILEGVTIGDGAIVGAGSVVSKSIEPYTIYAGNPMNYRRKRFSDSDIEFLLTLRWWDNDAKWIQNYAPYFANVSQLIEILRQELK